MKLNSLIAEARSKQENEQQHVLLPVRGYGLNIVLEPYYNNRAQRVLSRVVFTNGLRRLSRAAAEQLLAVEVPHG